MGRPVRTPEVAELRAFCTAVDLGSMGKAARLLRVSQPALSKRLRALEALSGSRLLERSTRGVSPTPAGKRLYGAARRLLEEAEEVEALMEGISADGAVVRLAASPTIAEFVLPPIMVELESRHERHLAVELSIANSQAVRRLVAEGRADIGIAGAAAGAEDGALSEATFCEDEIVVAVPPGHPWASATEVDPAELAAAAMIMRDPGADSRGVVSEAVEALGLSMAPPMVEIGSTAIAIRTAISEGVPVLLSLLALSQAGAELVVCPIAGLRFRRRFVLLHPSEASLPRSARSLARDLLDAAAPAAVPAS